MTLDEAIEHAEEKACGSSECAKDHKQLAEWLKELKERREAAHELRLTFHHLSDYLRTSVSLGIVLDRLRQRLEFIEEKE